MPEMFDDFQKWMYSRKGGIYKNLKMLFYMDGEPYFAYQGAECSYRDYTRRREIVKDVFTCSYESGGGKEYDGGIWKRKETPKTIIFTLIEEPFFERNYKLLKFKKDTKNSSKDDVRYSGFGNVMIDEEDGTFTIYPDQCGTPHIFESIKPEDIEDVIKKFKGILL